MSSVTKAVSQFQLPDKGRLLWQRFYSAISNVLRLFISCVSAMALKSKGRCLLSSHSLGTFYPKLSKKIR